MKRYRNHELAARNFSTTVAMKKETCVENDRKTKIRSGHGRDQLTKKATREGTAGVWSATVDAVLHGRRNHTPSPR